MKKNLLIAAMSFIIGSVYAQCSWTTQVTSEGGDCLGSATLKNSSTGGSISKIIWYNGNAALSTRTDTLFDIIATVAGGNGEGTAPNNTVFPQDVYVDNSGSIYVLGIGEVKKFPPGSTSATAGIIVAAGNGQGSDANQFDDPTGLFVDENGNIYVADAHNNRIQKWIPGATSGITVAGNGTIGDAANQLHYPSSVFLDGNGNMYVADNGNNRIQKFAPGSQNGVTVAGSNGVGSAANQFNGIKKVYVDGDGNLYVVDFQNSRVLKFPPGSTAATNGVTIAGGNSPGEADNQFNFPDGLFVDTNGNVYVSDQINNRIQKWKPGATSGITVAGGNGQGSAQNQFFGPRGIYVDHNGDIYIADSDNNRVQKWSRRSGIDTIYIPPTAGTYTAVVTDSSGCTMTSNPVIIYPTGISSVSITASSTNICAGDTVIFIADVTNRGNAPAYQWQVNGNNVGANSDRLINYSLSNGDHVNCIVTSSAKCVKPSASLEPIIMTVKPSVFVNIGNDTVIAPGKGIQLRPSLNGSIVSFEWTPAIGLDNPLKLDPFATPVSTTTYRFTVVSDDGCKTKREITITVYYALKMPNVFTPNGDGKNDRFRIPASTAQKVKNFTVYNRWGERIFTTTSSSGSWDGTFNNQQEPTGTYVWVIEYEDLLTGKAVRANGTFMLVR